ncbi:hypothetical protein GOB86_05275 [Acetobacter lambici]|uniref:Uncharacterized protein n=1 Tax=Acetobacter lambici TaxID=1332824 RepID=A0ABT1EXT1_9PROT|nr:hypothetical protein [Acetobacter lambici]MCP1257772.1 hypothetical protein [Acetobacter lambici]NHO56484.1 hypothetical protein [Acetobacter lambici]
MHHENRPAGSRAGFIFCTLAHQNSNTEEKPKAQTQYLQQSTEQPRLYRAVFFALLSGFDTIAAFCNPLLT